MEPTAIYSGKAEGYAAHRPDYSHDAISSLIELTGLGSTTVVADVGSGTGNMSRHILRHAARVFAVEPNDEMRHQAERLLGDDVAFTSIAGTAEQTTLPDASVDLIAVGQALHWFDDGPANREFSRILKPGGLLATVSNHFGGTPPDIDCFFASGTCRHRSFPVSIIETWEAFIGGARSGANTPVPGESGYDDFEKAHRARFESKAKDGLIEVSYTTELTVGEPRGDQ